MLALGLSLCLGFSPSPAHAAGQDGTTTIDADALIKRHSREGNHAWADDNVATLFYRGEYSAVAVWLSGDLLPLARVPDSDVWSGSRELNDLARGVFSYSFAVKHEDGSSELVQSPEFVWRGADAPAPVVRAMKLEGTISEHEIESAHLDSKRKATIYMPPASEDLPAPPTVIYMADGSSAEVYASVLDPLIAAGKLPPVVIVGVHQGGYVGERAADGSDYDFTKDLRAAEYLPALNSEYFPKHERFFCEDVVAWAESELGVSARREQRAILGHSNGGRFAATMGVTHPDVFGHVFAFSLGAGDAPEFDSEPAQRARFYFTAGTWESHYHDLTENFHGALEAAGFDSTFSSRVSGHDEHMWCEEFAVAVTNAFGSNAQEPETH